MKNKKNNIFTRRAVTNLVIICVGVLLFMALSNFGAIAGALGWLYSIVSPFVVGLVLAYILNIPMRFFERKIFAKTKRKRSWSILATYLLALFLVALLIGMVLPQVVESVITLVNNLPTYTKNLNELLDWFSGYIPIDANSLGSFQLSYADILNNLGEWLKSIQPQLLDMGVQIGSNIISGLVGALTALISSIYMLGSKEKLIKQAKRLLYAVLSQRNANETLRIGRLSNGVFSGFISGKILDSAIIGIICFLGMSIMSLIGGIFSIDALRMQYTVLISVVIGVTNVIPFFGPFIGAIPCVLILLMVNPWSALWFAVFVLVLQQFDGNILGPKILGNSTGLPAMWVLIAIIVGGGLFGFVGMLLGVPTTAVLYTLISDYVENRLRKRGLDKEAGLVPAGAEEATAVTEAEPKPVDVHEIADAPYVRQMDLLSTDEQEDEQEEKPK